MRSIQVILLVALLSAVAVYLRFLRSSLRDRLLALIFFVAACAAVVAPDLTQRAADLVGVGRGTDLTFYVLAVCFVFFAILIYSKVSRLDRAFTEVVRRVAIAEAHEATPPPPQEPR